MSGAIWTRRIRKTLLVGARLDIVLALLIAAALLTWLTFH